MNSLNTSRHVDVFNAGSFNPKRIDIIGAGAVGSKVAMELAKLGIDGIRVWDFDIVEEHNIPNQLYHMTDVGKLKVDALKTMIKEATTVDIEARAEKYEGQDQLGNVVFLLVDTMSGRKDIWNESIKLHPFIERIFETRMGSSEGRVYSLSPCDATHIKKWEETLYDDEGAEVSACGSTISVGPTASAVASIVVWQFVKWHNSIKDEKFATDTEHEFIFQFKPEIGIYTRNFNS